MSFGLLDLSIVTRRLLKQLTDCTTDTRIWDEPPPAPLSPGPPFTLSFTGLPPDEARKLDHCQLSLYLFHIAADKFYRNTYPRGGRARLIPEHPLALTLYYLLTAHSKNNNHAQQAMSVALKCFHEHSTLSATHPMDGRLHEFTLTLEPQSVDEIARLWQALATPIQLSAVYRVSVIFLEPETVERTPDLVLRPVIEFEDAVGVGTLAESTAPPISLTATVTADGVATITGQDFSASIEAQIGGHVFQFTATNPPEAGRFCVVSAIEFKLRFPAGVPAAPNLQGRYLLRVRVPGRPEATVWLVVP